MVTFKRAFLSSLIFLVSTCALALHKFALVMTCRIAREPLLTYLSRYTVLAGLLLTPQILSLGQLLWNIPIFCRTQHCVRPPWNTLLIDLAVCVAEPACLTGLIKLLLWTLPGEYCLVLVATPLLGLCLVAQLVSEHKSQADPKSFTKCKGHTLTVAYLTSVLLCQLLFLATVADLYIKEVLSLTDLGLLVVSIPGLALCWTRSLGGNSRDLDITRASRRMHFVYAFIKISCSCAFIVSAICLTNEDQNLSVFQVVRALSNIPHHVKHELFVMVGILVVSAIFFKGTIYLSATFCQPLLGGYLPSMLSTLATAAILMCIQKSSAELSSFANIVIGTPSFLCFFVLLITGTVAYILGLGSLTPRPAVLLAPYDQLFSGYWWNFLSLDLESIFSLYTRSKTAVCQETVHPNAESSIFLCATMYREDKREISTLLGSLIKLAVTKDNYFPNVSLYLHIFLDDSCHGDDLKPNALQLIGLLHGLQVGEGNLYLTAYGFQYRCEFPNKTPCILHLKDIQKFKGRKRWSQAMYMQFILKFCMESAPDNRHGARSNGSTDFKNCDQLVSDTIQPTKPTMFFSSDDVPSSLLHLDETKTISSTQDPIHNDIGTASSGDTTNSQTLGFPKYCNGCRDGCSNNSRNGCSHLQHPSFPVHTSKNSHLPNFHKLRFEPHNTYILTLDADIQFEPQSVWGMYSYCQSDGRVGGICGRTDPRGLDTSGPLVWYQKVQYAQDFWLLKTFQNVIGCVTCCPGCFAMFRAEAVRCVADQICEPTRTPADVYWKDIGEDRWITSLMMIGGWNIKYLFLADNITYCPTSISEFMRQRKRWILSDFSNDMLLVRRAVDLLRGNSSTTLFFLFLTCLALLIKLHQAAAILFLVAGAIHLMLGFNFLAIVAVLATIFAVYVISCMLTSGKTLVRITMVYSLVFGLIFAAGFLYFAHHVMAALLSTNVDRGQSSFQIVLMVLSAIVFMSLIFGVVFQPWQWRYLLYWPLLVLCMPLSLLLKVYSICSIGDQRWGTRDGNAGEDETFSCLSHVTPATSCCKGHYFRVSQTDDDSEDEEQVRQSEEMTHKLMSRVQNMAAVPDLAPEADFWHHLGKTTLGSAVNMGTAPEELADKLSRTRVICLSIYLLANVLVLMSHTFMYHLSVKANFSVGDIYFLVYSSLFLLTASSVFLAMTIYHLYTAVRITAINVLGDQYPIWRPTRAKYINTK